MTITELMVELQRLSGYGEGGRLVVGPGGTPFRCVSLRGGEFTAELIFDPPARMPEISRQD